MGKEQTKFQILKNKIKSFSKKQKILYFLGIIFCIVLIAFLIYGLVAITNIQSDYFKATDQWLNPDKNGSSIINGVDYGQIAKNHPTWGAKQIAWFLTSNDHIGGPIYIAIIIAGFLLLPLAIYLISFHAILLFPKKSKEEKLQKQALKKQKANLKKGVK